MEEVLYCESGESLEQVSQRRCGCPNPGSVQARLDGWGIEQLGLLGVVPADGWGIGS